MKRYERPWLCAVLLLTQACYASDTVGEEGSPPPDAMVTPPDALVMPPDAMVTSWSCEPGSFSNGEACAPCTEPEAEQWVSAICEPGGEGVPGSDTALTACSEPVEGEFVTRVCISGSSTTLGADTAMNSCSLASGGSVVTWGHPADGGDSSSVAPSLTSGGVEVFSNGLAFAALKSDGSVVTWGEARYGGDSSSVASSLSSGVVEVFAGERAFAALSEYTSEFAVGACEPGSSTTLGSNAVQPCTPIANCADWFVVCTDATNQQCRLCDEGYSPSADASRCTPAG